MSEGSVLTTCHYRGRRPDRRSVFHRSSATARHPRRQESFTVPSTPAARLSARISAVAESATLAVDAKAKAMKAAGGAVIGFGAGEPDFPTPAHIVEAAEQACRDPKNHRYSPAGGLPELREAVAVKTKRDSGYEVGAAQVVITNGGKHAVYNAFQVLLDPGDEVLLPAPYWTTYPEAITLGGGVTVPLPTDETTGFRVTVDQLDAACTPRTKALVFVSPSNPTGTVYPPDEVEAIGRWALDRGIWVVTDEIYEHLTFGEHRFTSMPVLVPGLADTCLVLNGVAKTYAMTGWRVGWMIAPPDVAKATVNLMSHSTSNVANVCQRAALAAVAGPLDAVHEMRAAFDRRGRSAHQLLNSIDGVTCVEPEGAFYAFPNLTGLLGRPIGGRSPATTTELAEVLLDTAKVAVVPGEAFGAPGYARISFALGDDDLGEGLRRITDLVAGG
ncbi:MAG: pyridoxal phosphate-dependent aminotransferase [Acidimicrobiia bacterium]|nr:pyridoxal phosphate-dependent aminotransferase [Acidimicrobiia bacterium]